MAADTQGFVDIVLQTNGGSITIPVNPAALPVSSGGANGKAEVVELGQIVIPRRPELKTITFDCFFLDVDEVNFILSAQNEKKVLRLIVSGLDIKFPARVIVNDFKYETRASEEFRTYYTLDLIEYRPYGAIEIKMAENKKPEPPAPARSSETAPSNPSTYLVKRGDSLWGITAKFVNGSRYMELFEANKAKITRQNNVIHPGDILNIPSNW